MNEKRAEPPQTDDLAAIEQWHENQEAEAPRAPPDIAAHGPVAIECRHGYDVCPTCDGEVAR